MDGILNINKEPGMTSHDVVARVRRTFKMKRVGHAGTLDPMATGVLVILLGKCTKLFDQFMSFDKGYRSTMLLGTTTDSADTDGNVTDQKPFDQITEDQFNKTLKKFEGDIKQLPPMYSAVKHKGQPLYKLARKGIEVKREPRDVRIDKLEVLRFDLPSVEFLMHCSKGTYVRQVAVDVGEDLGCGACISQLERTFVGPFKLEDAVKVGDINENDIRNWQDYQAA